MILYKIGGFVLQRLQNKTLEKSKSMLLELVEKGIELLKTALEKFKIQNEEINYIIDQADHVFSEYMENGLYDKVDSVCEDDLFDKVVDYSLNSAEYDIDDYINSLLDKKKKMSDEDRQAVIVFFHKIREITIEAQIKYGIKDSEHKVITKQIQLVQTTLDTIKQNINEPKPDRYSLIGILACEDSDSRTQELLSLEESNLLNLCEFNDNLTDVPKIKTSIELFKNKLDSGLIYRVKLACGYSLAFMVGAIFTQKITNLIFINRDNEWSFGRADKIKLNCKTVRASSDIINVAITVGTNSYIDDDVLSFIDEGQGLVCIHYDNYIQTSGQFNAIGNEITKILKKLASKSYSPLNIFFRGPAEIMFLLGQKSNDFGQCTIYEYNYKERDPKKRKYTKGITY